MCKGHTPSAGVHPCQLPNQNSDVFPIPFVPGPGGALGSKSSRIKQRGRAARELREVANGAIEELNRLYRAGGSSEATTPERTEQTGLVWQEQLSLAKRARRLPGEATGADALRELLKCDQPGYRSTQGKPHYLRKADVAQVDEPSDTRSASMTEHCTPEFLARFTEEAALRDASEIRRDIGSLTQHATRVYGSEAAYLAYLGRARTEELVGFMSPGYVKVINSVFFIFKKSGRLRKIIDCRPSNAYYKPSEDSTLPGPWHATDVQGGQFYSGEADVESAFTKSQSSSVDVEISRSAWRDGA